MYRLPALRTVRYHTGLMRNLSRLNSDAKESTKTYHINNSNRIVSRIEGSVRVPLKERAVRFFFPEDYPNSVSADYWNVQKYWNIQWAAGSALNVFTTQSLLSAVGVGVGASIPLAATINWVLKV
jgi:hypothetical protein